MKFACLDPSVQSDGTCQVASELLPMVEPQKGMTPDQEELMEAG